MQAFDFGYGVAVRGGWEWAEANMEMWCLGIKGEKVSHCESCLGVCEGLEGGIIRRLGVRF